jgi:hypothetical protein
MARNGIVATSQPLAAQAGLRILMAGGNAIDAAVGMAAVLNLVEPFNVGIGGDLFAIIYSAKDKKVYQLNAGGMAPTGATVAYYNSLGYYVDPKNWGYGSGMPSYGILSAPVPSAAWGWDEAIRKFGNLSLKEVLQPAIEYAEKGFPISEIIGNGAVGWNMPNGMDCLPVLQPEGSRLHRCLVYQWTAPQGWTNLQEPGPGAHLPPFRRLWPRCILQGRNRPGHRGQVQAAWRNDDFGGSQELLRRVGGGSAHHIQGV